MLFSRRMMQPRFVHPRTGLQRRCPSKLQWTVGTDVHVHSFFGRICRVSTPYAYEETLFVHSCLKPEA